MRAIKMIMVDFLSLNPLIYDYPIFPIISLDFFQSPAPPSPPTPTMTLSSPMQCTDIDRFIRCESISALQTVLLKVISFSLQVESPNPPNGGVGSCMPLRNTVNIYVKVPHSVDRALDVTCYFCT